MPIQNIPVNIDTTTYQAALRRANQAGTSLEQIIGDYLAQYAAGASSGSPTTYTVQRGDTLGRIARKVYNDPYKYPLLQKANNISDPSRIWIGQVLIIPAIAGSTDTTQPSAGTSTSTSSATLNRSTTTTTTTTTTPTTTPLVTKPAVEWHASPNFNNRRSTRDITAIVIHATANSTLEGVISWFQNTNAQVSAHYSIGKDGRIAQHVEDTKRAWHAGQSSWKGRSGCNDFCLGIELVNLNNGSDPYPEIQHQTNVNLCAYLCATYNISPNDIMAHYDCATPAGRKSDPRNYDMDRLRREVAAKVGRR